MKKIVSVILAAVFACISLPALEIKAADAPEISGVLQGTTYTWVLDNANGPGTFDYSDAHAAIRVGLGAGDSMSSAGIAFSSPSVKETNDTSGLANASESGRYVLIQPAYSGTISFTIKFSDAASSRAGRVYGNAFSEADFDAVDLSSLVKGAGDTLVNTTSPNSETKSFTVEAGKIYSLHTYNCVGTVSALSYSSPELAEGGFETADNLGFEDGLEGWITSSSAALSDDALEGDHSLRLGNGGVARTTVTGLEQGSYTVTMWVKGAGSNSTLTVSETGAPRSMLIIDKGLSGRSDWVQVAHRNVLVYNGQMTLEVAGGSTSGLNVDKIELTLDSSDNNPVENWGFEDGLDGWETKGTVEIDTANADTGSNAVRLADQSEVSQVIAVQPDTDYIATVRLKVDTADVYNAINQTALNNDANILGQFVERESLGNRVSVGVRGLDSTVLRQAPASTEDYELVSIAFHTGADQNHVEIYANTIFDQAYKDSITVYENTEGEYPNGWQRPDPTRVDATKLADGWTSNGNEYAYVDNFDVFQINNDYIKGADMSFLQVIEDAGGKYFAHGVQQDALRIISNHGVNSILQMIFVHSGNEIYDSGEGTLSQMSTSTIGYDGEYVTGRQQVYDYFDEDHTIALALRAQELGMTITLSFHYSDTWMTNGKAHIPLEWLEEDYEGNITNPNLAMLTTATYNYVHDFLTDMKAADVNNVISIKHGNEQDSGALFPIAQLGKGGVAAHAAIITASSTAANDVYPGVFNTIHSNTGDDTARLNGFFQTHLNAGAQFDGMAYSLYGGRASTSIFRVLQAAQNHDTLKYFDYINVETGLSFTGTSIVGSPDVISSYNDYYYRSANGQYNWLLDYIQASYDVPNTYGVMLGFYFWNAEAIAVYGAGHKLGEAVGCSTRMLFNNGTEAYGVMGDMLEGMYAYLHRGYTKPVDDSVFTPLRLSGINYPVTDATSISIEQSGIALQVGETERLHHTIAPVDALLNDYRVSYTSSDSGVAEVSPYGFITGVSSGTADITATIGTVSDTVTVTVGEAVGATGITVSYNIIRNGSIVENGTVVEGEALVAEPYDKVRFTTSLDGSPTDLAVVYSLDDSTVAGWYGTTWQTEETTMRTLAKATSTANATPIVQLNPRKGGTVNITAASAEGSATVNFSVQVNKNPVTSVVIDQGDTVVRAGRTVQLTATVIPENASYYKVNWESGDDEVATVDETGLVIGIQPGETTITAVSDADSDIKDSIVLTVEEVKVDELLISSSRMALMVGDSKTLSVTAVPENAVDKSVAWRVREGDEGIISVDSEGVVTGLALGTGTVLAMANDGGGAVAECEVTVQDTAIVAESMRLIETELWLKSSYFSPDAEARSDTAPVYKLEIEFTPIDTTNTTVRWGSDNTAVATVDDNGIVTAHKGGVATITAEAEDGGFTESAVLYIPDVSEDWENHVIGNPGGITSGDFSFAVVEDNGSQKLQAAIQNTSNAKIGRYGFEPVGGDLVVVDFDWDVGTVSTANSNVRGGHLLIEDEGGNVWLALAVFPQTGGTPQEMVYYYANGSTNYRYSSNYIHGGTTGYSDCVGLGVPAGGNQVYNIRLELDFDNDTISFTVTDVDDPNVAATVSDIAMHTGTNYTGSVAAIAFSTYFNGSNAASWTTAIDNLGVYNAGIVAEGVDYNISAVNFSAVNGLKLVPVENALSATATIHANVVPAAADQELVFSVSDTLSDFIEIDANGIVTVKQDKLVAYDNQNAIQSASGTVRISAAANPNAYAEFPLTVGSPNASETLNVYVDGTLYDAKIMLDSQETVTLSFKATGGDGNTDLYSYNWEVTAGNAQIDPETQVLTASEAGEVTVTFTLDAFRGPLTRTLDFAFQESEEAVLESIELEGPNKTLYNWGDELDLAGLKVTALYSDGESQELEPEEYTVSGFNGNEEGEQTITVSYTEGDTTKIATFTVTVEAQEPPVEPVDKSVLNDLLADALALNLTGYTEASVQALEAAIANAQAVSISEEAEQEVVDTVTQALRDAIDGLEPDRQPLLDLLAEAQERNEADYTPESWAVFIEAKQQAQEAVDAETASVGSLADAYDRLQEAMMALYPADVDTSSLQELLEQAQALLGGSYTESSLAALELAIEATRELLAGEPNAEQVTDAYTALHSTMNSLVGMDKAELAEWLGRALEVEAAQYTDESYADVQAAIDAAEQLMENGNAAQSDINAAVKLLKEAIEALEPLPTEPEPEPVDRQELYQAIAQAEEYLAETEVYTEETLAALQEAVAAARLLAEQESIEQDAVNVAAKAIRDAIEALRKKDGVTEPGTDPEPEPGDKEYKLLDGANGEYTGGTSGLVFRSEGELASLQRVTVDGKALTLGTHFTLAEGSTVVTLLPAYLDTLANGEHTLRMVFADGETAATFTVKRAEAPGPEPTPGQPGGNSQGGDVPPTGDGANTGLWLLLALLALVALGGALVWRRKKYM